MRALRHRSRPRSRRRRSPRTPPTSAGRHGGDRHAGNSVNLRAAPITRDAPYVSVVIDTYNYGRFVVQAVESVRRQTFPAAETEILVVDDGSTDDTRTRLEPYGD